MEDAKSLPASKMQKVKTDVKNFTKKGVLLPQYSHFSSWFGKQYRHFHNETQSTYTTLEKALFILKKSEVIKSINRASYIQ